MKVLVVDDEAPARLRLTQLLDDIDGFACVGEAANGNEALDRAAELEPDIVLLDIRMPGIDGIEAAHHLNKLSQPPAVVFTTAYDEYAIDAFEAQAIGYVLKPVRRERLFAALQQASRLAPATLANVADKDALHSKRQHVCARTQDRLQLVPISEIAAFHADQKYVTVEHDGGETLIDESLKSLESEFGDTFVRIHRNMLVAVNRIESVERTADGKHQVFLRGDSTDSEPQRIVSRRHVADVRKRLRVR